jgi:hypothetical protein
VFVADPAEMLDQALARCFLLVKALWRLGPGG